MVALRRALAWVFTVPATRLALLLPAIAVPAAVAILLRAFGPALLDELPMGWAIRVPARLLIDAAHATALVVSLSRPSRRHVRKRIRRYPSLGCAIATA